MSATSSASSSSSTATLMLGFATPVTLRMYCRAAASISSRVAGGSSPRSSVMFRHIGARLGPRRNRESRALASSGMRNALITGTSTGIGEACVARLAEEGWTVYAGVRRAEDGDRVKAQHPGDVRPVILDVMKRDDVTRVIDGLTREVGDRGL